MTMKPKTQLDGWDWQEIRDCIDGKKRKMKNLLRRKYRRQLKIETEKEANNF